MSREQTGVLLCLLSAAAFSSSTIFGRIALEDGAGVTTILVLRYGAAAPLFWVLVRLAGQSLPPPSTMLKTLALGAVVVSAQALLIYLALDRLSAGLVVLLLYTFPAMVAVVAVTTGREQPSILKATAILVAMVGTALAMLGGGPVAVDSLGVVYGLASAVACAVWILFSDRIVQGVSALTVSALMSTGAALTLCSIGLALGAVELSFGPAAALAIVGTILISTIVAFATSLAGMARVGPTVASVLMTAEIPLAVAWSILLLGESLQPLQFTGGGLVLSAVLLLQLGGLRWPPRLAARYAPLMRSTGRVSQPPAS